jgi:enamine deaminase RidA (YjgF/YER057c/UK114 family)
VSLAHEHLNVATALAAAGASFDDVAKLTLYVVDWTPDKLAALGEGIARAAETLGITARPPLTGLLLARARASSLTTRSS